jgi:3alpha(or 20beta)-hydroxysteroid dehydrogenase
MGGSVDLTGSAVVLTGANGGLGRSHVAGLLGAGATVLACDLHDKCVSPDHERLSYVRLDVTDEAQWVAAMASAEALGPVRGLVNNAGLLTRGSTEHATRADWDATLAVNLTGAWLGMRAVIPAMRRAGGGCIVNVSSTAGLQGYAGVAAYVASKWGLRGLTKAAAVELGTDGIRVNSLHPGPVRTPMIDGYGDDVIADQPLRRFGEPAEVTTMLLFILSGATHTTGTEFVVDGGALSGRVDED